MMSKKKKIDSKHIAARAILVGIGVAIGLIIVAIVA